MEQPYLWAYEPAGNGEVLAEVPKVAIAIDTYASIREKNDLHRKHGGVHFSSPSAITPE